MLARCKQPTDLSSHWLQQGSAKKEGHVKQKGTQTQQSTCVSGVKHNNPKTGLKIQKKCCCEKKNSWWEVAITWDPNKNLKKSKRRRDYWLGTRAWREKNLPWSVESTLVTCWKKQGCDMSHLRGGGASFGVLFFCWLLLPVQKRRRLEVLDELLGADSRMFAGSDVSVSMWRNSCWAASAESKLSPAICLWSVDVLIVWNVGPPAS